MDDLEEATCCICGASVDTREVDEGGGPDGAELTDGRWVCSPGCWDQAAGGLNDD